MGETLSSGSRNAEIDGRRDDAQWQRRMRAHGGQTRRQPGVHVSHHLLSAVVVEQIVDVPIVKLQSLVRRASGVEEELTSSGAREFIGGAVENQHRQLDEWEFPPETVRCADELG